MRSLWQRPHDAASLSAQIREEVETHVAMAVEHLIAQGATREHAEAEARKRFGNYDAALHTLYSSAHQREVQMNRKERLDNLRQDIRLALRMFGRSPLFFIASILTLAIGIGANGAVFTVLQASLLQPLPYRNADELAMLWRTFPNEAPPPGKSHAPLHRGVLTSKNLLDWRAKESAQLGETAALLSWQGDLEAQFDLLLGDRAERLNGVLATPNFFTLLGVHADYGRVFTAADEAQHTPVVVISHALWERDFGSDPAVIGRAITFNSGQRREPHVYTVIGVLPPEIRFTYPVETEAWVMMPWSYVEQYDPHGLAFFAVMRRRPGLSLELAQAQAAAFEGGLDQPNVPLADREAIALEPMHEWIVGETRPALLLLGSVAGLLLLITCLTVANGLFARVSARQDELAVRAALGAERGRLIQQLLTEGALLSIAGAGAGMVLAIALQPILRAFIPASLPAVGEIGVNVPIVLFGIFIAVATTLLAAVAPAFVGVHRDTTGRLTHSAGRMSAAGNTVRLRQWLVGAQSAIATTLLISATLLLVSFWKLGHVPLGYDGDRVLTAEMRLIGQKYRGADQLSNIQSALLQRVAAIPGVTEVSLTSAVPFRGVDFISNVGRVGATTGMLANTRYVDAEFFRLLRIPRLSGRLLLPTDRRDTPPVAVISASLARALFGTTNPIGQTLVAEKQLEIVGVVGDVRYQSRDKAAQPAVYISRSQIAENLICILVRSTGDVTALAAPLRTAIHDVDPTIPAMKISTLDRIIEASVANRRFYTVATTTFAVIALLLTVAGLIVVVTRTVTERRRELAIRSALGATDARLFRSATTDVVLAAALGIAVGGAAVYAAATGLSQFLFEVTSRSPTAYGASTALVLLVTLVAAAVPIFRFRQLSLAALLKIE